MSKLNNFFVYSWHSQDEYTNSGLQTIVRLFGINERNETVMTLISDFTPFLYMELPPEIQWTETNLQTLGNKIDYLCGDCKPLKKRLMSRKKLYFSHKDPKTGEDILFPFLFVSFKSIDDRRKFSYRFRKPITVYGITGTISIKLHEIDADPILQLNAIRDLPSCGWIAFTGKEVKEDDRESSCKREYIISRNDLKKSELTGIPRFRILSFDIEVNSVNPRQFPSASRPENVIFQISAVFCNQGEKSRKKILLSLGQPKQELVGEDVIIQLFDTESELLDGFSDLITEEDPQIMIGYNIFGFDLGYMMDRAEYGYKGGVCARFMKQGYLVGKAGKNRPIKWSSSAFGTQDLRYLDIEGRIFIDLLTIVKRDYKMNSYSLKSIATYFLGQTKDPLGSKGIFKCYQLYEKDKRGELGKKSMGIVGKYCIQDSFLVLELFESLNMMIGLIEMSRVCNVPILTLFTQGQQIKMYSQIYKMCMKENFVAQKDGYIPKDTDRYTGALVIMKKAGLYDMITSFDFSSLYPSIIIAYNICYTTLVNDPKISDEKCHVFNFFQHQGCIHDLEPRKTKVKKENILCGRQYHRYLKEPMGILPRMLKALLDARKRTNGDIKVLKGKLEKLNKEKDDLETKKKTKEIKVRIEEIDKEKEIIERELIVLDKRQLSYKINANSGYGSLGVRRGYLPLLPGAVCVTGRGRELIMKASKFLEENKCQVIYNDTDSCYVHYPHLKTAKEYFDYSLELEKKIESIFPSQIKLAFEGKIFRDFLVFTKKKYIYSICDIDGNVVKNKKTGEDDIQSKGVILTRRDNSKFNRDIYKELIAKIFKRVDKEDIFYFLIQKFNELCSGSIGYKSLVISKKVGDPKEYKVRDLSQDIKKREKRLKDLKCGEDDYHDRALPPHVQLALKMEKRGGKVEANSRLEYVMLSSGEYDKKEKLYEKIEDYEYYLDFKHILRLDYLYYLRLSMNSLDQAIETVFGIKKFVFEQHALRTRKFRVCCELRELFKPTIVFKK